MTTKAITPKNYRYAPTADLEAAVEATDKLLETLGDDQAELIEYCEELVELITDELAERELEENLPGHDDTPSLQDEGIELGSYAS